MSDDRVLWITGASAGIGAATARLAGASGWRLVLAARSLNKLIARAALYALEQPPHVDINEILVRSTAQEL